jgi:hypothetical protein
MLRHGCPQRPDNSARVLVICSELEDVVQHIADAALVSPSIRAELAEAAELAWRDMAEAHALGLIRITWAEDGTILGIELLADVVLH